jgi:PHS family inorganic phosphate transporter-like MFS transporter
MAASDAAGFGHIDESKISNEQWRIVLISGMGFFTDAYDLFVIGVALKLITSEWHLDPLAIAVVGATALVSAAIGSAVFGRIADVFGRKYIYGFEVLVLGAGAIASAFSPNVWWLIAFRFILGLGIGGDYPVSATIASEFSGSRVRGRMISSVFAMQGLGLVVGPLLAMLLLSIGTPSDLTWRILLAAGAIPPLAVFWARRHLKETPRFEKLQSQQPPRDAHEAEDRLKHSFDGLREGFRDGTIVRWLWASSFAWFVLDLAYYGNTISNQQFVGAVAPHASQVHTLFISFVVFLCAALPGYVLSVYGMDRWGRKTIQMLGFGVMALTFAGIALLGDAKSVLVPFVILYGLNYFFTEFGPNTTTFIYPAEIFPVRVRTTSHGIAATIGKVGAAIGTFSFPLLQSAFGLPGPMWVAAVASLIGLAITWRFLPEPNGLDLEAASRDETFTAPSAKQQAGAPKPAFGT